jgi:hypothetical protein
VLFLRLSKWMKSASSIYCEKREKIVTPGQRRPNFATHKHMMARVCKIPRTCIHIPHRPGQRILLMHSEAPAMFRSVLNSSRSSCEEAVRSGASVRNGSVRHPWPAPASLLEELRED